MTAHDGLISASQASVTKCSLSLFSFVSLSEPSLLSTFKDKLAVMNLQSYNDNRLHKRLQII